MFSCKGYFSKGQRGSSTRLCLFLWSRKPGYLGLAIFQVFAHRVSIFSELLFTLLGQKKRERDKDREREGDMWDLGIRHMNSFM